MSIRLMTAVWKCNATTVPIASHRLMLLKLADCANDDGWGWPAMATIAAACGVSVRQAQKIKAALVKGGFVHVETSSNGRDSNRYRVIEAALHVEPIEAGGVTDDTGESDGEEFVIDVGPTGPDSASPRTDVSVLQDVQIGPTGPDEASCRDGAAKGGCPPDHPPVSPSSPPGVLGDRRISMNHQGTSKYISPALSQAIDEYEAKTREPDSPPAKPDQRDEREKILRKALRNEFVAVTPELFELWKILARRKGRCRSMEEAAVCLVEAIRSAKRDGLPAAFPNQVEAYVVRWAECNMPTLAKSQA